MGAIVVASRNDGGGVLAILVLIIIGIWFTVLAFQVRGRTSVLEATAHRLGGRRVSNFWGNDHLEFEVDGVRAELTYHPARQRRAEYTRIRFLEPPPGVLRIVPKGPLTALRKLFGAQDIEVGDQAFDGAFLIEGSPEPWVREMLDPLTRRRIFTLAGMGANFWKGYDVAIEAGPSGIRISSPRCFVSDREQLDSFIDQSVAIFKRLRRHQSEGIKILSADERAERGECPVCACPLAGPTTRCAKCRTLHHADCWEYFGGCAIYACSRQGGRRS